MKISVIIITHDSSLYLDEVLRKVEGFDDILVCDLGSQDATLQIAHSRGARVVEYEYADNTTLERVREFAVSNALHDWVFIVEPNELVTDALRQYLYDFISQKPDAAGLFIPRKNYLMHRMMKSSYPDYRLRFFRKAAVKWPNSRKDRPDVDGLLTSIPAARRDTAMIHLSRRFEQGRDRAGRAIALRARRNSARKVTLSMLMWRPTATFLDTYLRQGALFYGREGFIAAMENAADVFRDLTTLHKQMHLREFNEENAKYDINIEKLSRTRD